MYDSYMFVPTRENISMNDCGSMKIFFFNRTGLKSMKMLLIAFLCRVIIYSKYFDRLLPITMQKKKRFFFLFFFFFPKVDIYMHLYKKLDARK